MDLFISTATIYLLTVEIISNVVAYTSIHLHAFTYIGEGNGMKKNPEAPTPIQIPKQQQKSSICNWIKQSNFKEIVMLPTCVCCIVLT